ncbi:MAG: hypothetical protein U1E70_04665 [Acetobacteraceae bacterium]|nr:hypothetical protein [Pseudomonadota bacterium]
MGRIRSSLLLTAVAAVLAACTPPTPQVVQQRGDMLTAAGFKVIPADTPDREASLSMLPPQKFTRQQRDGATVFTYADPLVCNCLYVGDQAAYDSYRAAMRAKNRQAAEESQSKIVKMDWGAWPAFGP